MDQSDEQLYRLLDLIISEYGWSLKYVLSLPHDVIAKLVTAISKRKTEHLKLTTKLMGAAVSCGFNGKLDQLDKIFDTTPVGKDKEDIDEEIWRQQVKSLWFKAKSHGNNLSADKYKNLQEEFDREWKQGNIKF